MKKIILMAVASAFLFSCSNTEGQKNEISGRCVDGFNSAFFARVDKSDINMEVYDKLVKEACDCAAEKQETPDPTAEVFDKDLEDCLDADFDSKILTD